MLLLDIKLSACLLYYMPFEVADRCRVPVYSSYLYHQLVWLQYTRKPICNSIKMCNFWCKILEERFLMNLGSMLKKSLLGREGPRQISHCFSLSGFATCQIWCHRFSPHTLKWYSNIWLILWILKLVAVNSLCHYFSVVVKKVSVLLTK